MMKEMKYLSRQVMCLALLVCCVFTASALDKSFYAESSKLATGKWVKISVTESGIYQITAEDIRAWGLGSDLSKIHVFGYGGAPLSETMNTNYADDLPQMPIVRTTDRILFYGQGPVTWKYVNDKLPYVQVQHPYALSGTYFVTNDDQYSDIDIEEARNEPFGDLVTTFTGRLYHEQDIINPGETGKVFLGESFVSNKTQTFKFSLDGLVDGSKVNVYTVFSAKLTGAGCTIAHSYNGNALPQTNTDLISPVEDLTHEHYRNSLSNKELTLEGTHDLNYTLGFSCPGTVLLARLDYITVNYERQLALSNGSLTFGFDKARKNLSYRISGCGSATRVWDVTAPYHPVQLNAVSGDGTVTFCPQTEGRREFVAFDESKSERFPHPVSLGEVPNQDIHSMETPDMIILAPSAYLDQANRVAALHEQVDHFKVLVLDHEKVFNEFSSGTRDAMAYRRLCKMFYDRSTGSNDGHKLGYLLLFGCGSYDNKLIGTNTDALGYPSLLTWQTESSQGETSSFTTDAYYGVLDDNTSLSSNDIMRIAVGRMPVKSVNEARTAVNKLIKYVTTPAYGSWKNQVLVVADDENAAVHMKDSDHFIGSARGNGGDDMVFNRVYIDAFDFVSQGGARNYPDARAKMFTTLKEGALWWNYVGHASTQNWTAEGLMMRSDVETQLYYKHLPVLYAATCEFSRFDCSILSSGMHMFLNANGGAIALICPARLAGIGDNGRLTTKIGVYAFSKDESGRPRRIGDIYRLALNEARCDNNRRFFVFGDPAMRLAYAPYTAHVETINGQPVDPDNKPVFKARETVEFSGKILGLDGNPVENFDGNIVSTLFGPMQSVTTHGYYSDKDHPEDGVQWTYEDRANRLAINVDTVKNGRFTVRVIIPSEVNNEYDDYSPSLINLYAYDSRDTLEAKGYNSDFFIYGYEDEEVTDTIGPDIIRFTLNDDSFVNGGDINESPLMLATVVDESGVNFSTAGIGHSMTLTLDGINTYNDVASYYTPMYAESGTMGSISYQLSDLTPGPHTLRLRVWDVYSNVSEKTISFNVVNGLAPEIADVFSTSNPASVETSFYVKHNRPDAIVSVTIEVYDLMGRLVWKSTQSGRSDMYSSTPITWDLTDRGGRRVPRGIYVYRATISTDGVKEATKAKKLAVGSE